MPSRTSRDAQVAALRAAAVRRMAMAPGYYVAHHHGEEVSDAEADAYVAAAGDCTHAAALPEVYAIAFEWREWAAVEVWHGVNRRTGAPVIQRVTRVLDHAVRGQRGVAVAAAMRRRRVPVRVAFAREHWVALVPQGVRRDA